MRKLGLLMLLVGLGVLASFVTASAMPFKDDPAGQVAYFKGGGGVLLYDNLTGIGQNAIVIFFTTKQAKVDLDPSKTFAFGGPLVNLDAKQTKALAPDIWRVVFTGPVITGGTIQVYFTGDAAIRMVILGSR